MLIQDPITVDAWLLAAIYDALTDVLTMTRPSTDNGALYERIARYRNELAEILFGDRHAA